MYGPFFTKIERLFILKQCLIPRPNIVRKQIFETPNQRFVVQNFFFYLIYLNVSKIITITIKAASSVERALAPGLTTTRWF